jgi:hypothetical protein
MIELIMNVAKVKQTNMINARWSDEHTRVPYQSSIFIFSSFYSFSSSSPFLIRIFGMEFDW